MPVNRRKRKRKPKPLTEEQKAVVAANRGLIGVACKGLTFNNMSSYECDQEGVVALAHAVQGFNPKKGVCFSTYAVQAIRNALMRRDQEFALIHVPHYLRTKDAEQHRYQRYARAVDGRVSIDEAMKWGWNPPGHEDEESEFGYQAMRAVCWAIRKLSPVERQVVRAVVFRNETPGVFGKKVGMSYHHVKKVKMQAFAKLRATLAKHV